MPLPYDFSRCTCPRCLNLSASLAPDLAAAHGDATQDYFRCEHCAHIWTRVKRASLQNVAPLSAARTQWQCPRCMHRTDALVPGVSQYASVNYLRCQDCGHIWNVRKTTSESDQPTVVRRR